MASLPEAYPQLTREISCPSVYLKIQVSFPETTGVEASRKLTSDVLQEALTQLHGFVGGAVPLEMLQHQSTHNGAIAVFRMAKQDVSTVISSAACLTRYDNLAVRLHVLSVSPFLSTMASDSRAWQQALASSL